VALARLRELEVAEKEGKLVSLADMKKERFELGRVVSDGILNVPDRICYSLAAETDPKKVRAMLRGELAAVLEALADDKNGNR
jgi:hypothetical protein